MSREKPRRTLGRFEIVRPLGEGAQGTVYLANDSHLGRQVAIKTLSVQAGAAGQSKQLQTLLDEARIVSQLSHPNIITLYDVGEDQGLPYLVFEYVRGELLRKLFGNGVPIDPATAADICIQVLRAIDYAHRHGVLHRDIKPTNIMITEDGVARIMDFGIAQLIDPQTPSEEPFRGTPRYMAPEYITDRVFTKQCDLFSVGMLLHEMLTGHPVVTGDSVVSILNQIAHHPIDPPSRQNPQLDESLDLLVMRALAIDPRDRFETAAHMEEAIYKYLNPEPVLADPGPANGGGTLEFLIRRMRHKSDFPALSTTISTVNKTATSEIDGVKALSTSILKDFALTNNLLKLVNTAHYGRYGGAISTISRAVVVLGFDRVRSAAATLLLFEHLQNKGLADQLKEDLIGCYFGALLSRDLASTATIPVAEEAFICSMFHDLGRLLTRFYFTEESREIDKLTQQRKLEPGQASFQVLGITFEALGIGVAKHWKFPAKLVESMHALKGDTVSLPLEEAGRLQVLAELSAQVVAAIRDCPVTEINTRLSLIIRRFRKAIRIDEDHLLGTIRQTLEYIRQDASFLNFNPEHSRFIRKAVAACPDEENESQTENTDETVSWTRTEPITSTEAALAGETSDCAVTVPNALLEAMRLSHDTVDGKSILSAGIQDITNCLVGQFRLNDVLEMILETMFRGINFSRVLLCVRDPRDGTLRARFGFGDGVDDILERGFTLSTDAGNDIFQTAVRKGVDIVVEDVNSATARDRIPAWYRKRLQPTAVALFPVVVNAKTIGLFYADKIKGGRLELDREELSLLKTLRNQAVIAIRASAA